MKARKLARAVSLSTLAMLAGCSTDGDKTTGMADAATKQAAEAGYDASKLTPEAAKAEATKIVNQAAAKLGSIKDAVSAESVSKELQPLLDKLGPLKAAAGKLDLSSLQKTVTDLIAKFKDDPKIQAALKPLLDKITNLMK